jgi:hypothetical protein
MRRYKGNSSQTPARKQPLKFRTQQSSDQTDPFTLPVQPIRLAIFLPQAKIIGMIQGTVTAYSGQCLFIQDQQGSVPQTDQNSS